MSQSPFQTSDSKFQSEVLNSPTPILVDFWADWCGPCKAVAPKLEQIAEELGEKIKIAKIDVDANQITATQFGVRSIPTMILFKNGKAVDQIMGNQPKERLLEFIAKHI